MHNKELILSFTSHKTRIPLIDEVFKNHTELAKTCGMRVCFACQDDTLPFLTEYQKSLIRSGEVELLHTPKDHGSNTKWTLCRQKYPNAVLVVVDDDWIYDKESIRSLLEVHKRRPKAVVCRAYRTIPWVGNKLPLYTVKPNYSYPKTVTAHIKTNLLKDHISETETTLTPGTFFPEHFLGILYPPGFPSCSPSTIPQECYKDDDVFLGARVAAEKKEVVFAGSGYIAEDCEIELPGALWANSRAINGQGTFNALKSVESEFKSSLINPGLGQVILMTCRKYPLRRKSIAKELDRIGIEFTEQYDDGSEYPNIGFKHKRLNRCHLAKYLALSKFEDTSFDRVTLIEDDVRFLKSISDVSLAIQSMPASFGACRLSWGVSPYIRGEMLRSNPKEVVRIEKELSRNGSFWAECPWGSTDGCTIMSREVALRFRKELELHLQENPSEVIDNSDDMLCRICAELGKPLFVYKPLVCLQVEQSDVERGKSGVGKFFLENDYHIHGVVLPQELYATNHKPTIATPNGYRIRTIPRVYYGQQPQSNLEPKKKGWNW